MPRFANPPPVKTPVTNQVDPSKLSAAYRLFHDRYECITEQMNLYSKEYLSVFGMVTTGDKKQDEAMAKYPVRVWLAPASMAQFLDQGSSFSLVKREETATIYGLIIEHLTDWKRHLQFELNPYDVPWDDLRMFEALAKEMYPTARGYIKNLSAPFDMFSKMGGGVMRGLSRSKAPEKKDADKATPEAHTPILETMRQEIQANQNTPAASRKTKPWLQSKTVP